MTQLSDESKLILERCEFDPYNGNENAQQNKYFNEGAEIENARLLPVIQSLLELVEAQAEALEWVYGTICQGDVYNQESNEQNRLNLLNSISRAKEALAHKTEVLKGLAL